MRVSDTQQGLRTNNNNMWSIVWLQGETHLAAKVPAGSMATGPSMASGTTRYRRWHSDTTDATDGHSPDLKGC